MQEKLSKAPINKVVTLKEAVAQFVADGAYLSFGGIGDRTPTAAVHEVARQRKKNLRLVSDTSVSFVHDSILIGLGLVDKFEIAYNWGGIWGSDEVYRRALEKEIPRKIEIEEYSNLSTGMRFLAGSMGLSFMPVKSLLGSDIPVHNPRIKIIDDPYTGEPVALVPAANPDVAFIHVQRCDKFGNAQILGHMGDDDALARAAQHVIITAEEIVPTDEIRRYPNLTCIPYYCVNAVVQVPFGSHGRGCSYYYAMDVPYGNQVNKAWSTHEGFEQWAEEWIYGVNDWEGYCQKLGWDRLMRLARAEQRYQKFGEVR
ncbi:CoA transferase subunit A [Syntrophomonas palmitatica]|uniref:CoA transferase subunit A n=1 Tax=Syntrophomonas palmitatica TaxID=402877 RepID=UPI0006D2B384|nr:CoA-transferase [Syntrophomonas palmitatica]